MTFSLKLKTVQSDIIKTLFEALKQILSETNIEFTPEGMRILTMDESHSVLIRLNLEGDKFNDYHCPAPIIIGVDLNQLFSLLKSMGKEDVLTFYIRDDDPNCLGIVMENNVKGEISCYQLKLQEPSSEQYKIPQHEYPYITNMPSADFQKICRNMKNLSAERMDIKHHKDQLFFRCEGEYATQETIRTSGTNLQLIKTSDKMYAGTFDLDKLVDFVKCTGLGSTVTILMQNMYPLIFIYPVGGLGDITLCLAPLNNSE